MALPILQNFLTYPCGYVKGYNNQREYFEDDLNIFGEKITKLEIMDDIQHRQILNFQSILEILEQNIT